MIFEFPHDFLISSEMQMTVRLNDWDHLSRRYNSSPEDRTSDPWITNRMLSLLSQLGRLGRIVMFLYIDRFVQVFFQLIFIAFLYPFLDTGKFDCQIVLIDIPCFWSSVNIKLSIYFKFTNCFQSWCYLWYLDYKFLDHKLHPTLL